MKIKKHWKISTLLEIGSMIFALGVLAKVMLERLQLPAGACPVDNNRPLLYVAIILLIVVNLGTYLYGRWKKKRE
jgi:hypothetical protein